MLLKIESRELFNALADDYIKLIDEYREKTGDPMASSDILIKTLEGIGRPDFFIFFSIEDLKLIGFGLAGIIGSAEGREMNIWKVYSRKPFNADLYEGLRYLEKVAINLGIHTLSAISRHNGKIFGKWLGRLGFNKSAIIYRRSLNGTTEIRSTQTRTN